MTIYEAFAGLYAKGPYPEYSVHMAEMLPPVLELIGARPKSILDVACGEGAFAVKAAKVGFRVTGIDLSDAMLRLARKRAEEEEVDVEFLLQDMRCLPFEESFDLVTCWYDSLNYLLTLDDLEKAFTGAARALKKDGFFIFDMNTVYGLAVLWQQESCYVQQENQDLLEIHRASFDFEKNIATLKITGFTREGKEWTRIDEEHKERGYSLEEIRACAAQAGFREVECWGSIREMGEPTPESGRIWLVLQKAEI